MNQSHTKKLIRKSLFNSEYSTEASTNLVSQSPSLTFLDPISAGVLENQNMLGGGHDLTPPLSKSHV